MMWNCIISLNRLNCYAVCSKLGDLDLAEFNVAKYYNLTQKSYFDKLGKVSKIVGLTIESIGPDAKLNDLCVIHSADNEFHLYAEVVGFKDSRVLLMPFDNVDGIGPGCIVENTEKP